MAPLSCLGIVWELPGICLGPKVDFWGFSESGIGGGRLAHQSCLGIVWEFSGICLALKSDFLGLFGIWAWGRKSGPPELSGNCLGIVWDLSGPRK